MTFDEIDALVSCEREVSLPCITQVTGGVAGPLCPLCAAGLAALVKLRRLPADTPLLDFIFVRRHRGPRPVTFADYFLELLLVITALELWPEAPPREQQR